MKIIKNEKLIKRNAKIGQYASFVGIFVIIGVTIFLFQSTLNPESVSGDMTWIMLVVLLVSMIISQVSMYFGTRWGRRPDEALESLHDDIGGVPGMECVPEDVLPRDAAQRLVDQGRLAYALNAGDDAHPGVV